MAYSHGACPHRESREYGRRKWPTMRNRRGVVAPDTLGRSGLAGGLVRPAVDLGIFDRCIAFAPVSSALPFNTVQIVQAPG